jgi:hypothetical protein
MAIKIPKQALQRGPDLLFPGSMTQMKFHGMGNQTFLYSKYPDAKGSHFFLADASVPHIKLINKPNIINALMGPNKKKLVPLITEKIDGKVQLDPLLLRAHTIEESIFGRTGFAFNEFLIMFWVVNDWALAIKALDCLKADDSAIVTVGTDIIGTVAQIRAKHSKVTKT